MLFGLEQNEKLNLAMLDNQFLINTQQQLVKDFRKVNVEFPQNFSTEVCAKEEIVRLIENEVASISEKGERYLLQLLYTVDFPEKLFLQLTHRADFLNRIAEQILYREAYKIWLRENYSI